jgi:hypothetical protein
VLRQLSYWLRRAARPAEFAIRIRNGVARLERGRVPAGFVEDCTSIAAEFECGDGWIEGVRGSRGVNLRFSPGIGERSHQRFRNVFGLPGDGS